MNTSTAAAEAISFLHDLHRLWGNGSMEFAPYDADYQAFLRHVCLACFAIGIFTFVLLVLIVARRVFLPHGTAAYSQSRAPYTRLRRGLNRQASFDVCAVILLGVTALSALAGLLAEAQVDYSVHHVAHSLTNASHTFHTVQTVTTDVAFQARGVRATVDDMLVAYNSTLPRAANDLAVQAMRLAHAGALLSVEGHALPSNLTAMAHRWEAEYFWVKSSTNGIILSMALSCFLAIAAIGWSMSASLRIAILFALLLVPSAHALFGVYLSNAIEAADFCVAPAANTAVLFHNDSGVAFFVNCPANTSLYASSWTQVNASLDDATNLTQALDAYALTLPTAARLALQQRYLDPLADQLGALEALRTQFAATAACAPMQRQHAAAVDSWCSSGVLGLLSLWLHQMVLCTMLFVSLVALVSVYEDVRGKEDRIEMQYHLLSSYEDESGEHLYMTAE